MLLDTLLHHPRRLWVRRAVFQIHLWAGVLLSLYVVVIALTGSVLVFRTELTRVGLPRGLSAYDARQTAPIAVVVAQFVAAYPGAKLVDLQVPSAHMPAFLLSAADAHRSPFRLLADPVTGRVGARPQTWMDWVYDLHVFLLLGHAYGMQVNGVGAVFLLLLTFSGLFLWWPGVRSWMRGLRIDFRRNWRRINFDAHNAIGFWTLLIVSCWGVSGVYFAWYPQVTAVVARVSPLQGMLAPKAAVPVVSGSRRASREQVLSAVHEASPKGRLFSLSDPMLAGATVYALVDLRAPGDFSHRDIVTVSSVDARVLGVWHYGENHSVGDWVLWSMFPLHFGSLWGLGFKVVWALAGVALAMLVVTGLLMYWNRFLRHRLRGR
jgi:uncharacterized iron-regulated membrane protein